MKLHHVLTTIDFVDEDAKDNWKVCFTGTFHESEAKIYRNNVYITTWTFRYTHPSKKFALKLIVDTEKKYDTNPRIADKKIL